ncbi:MAG: ABC transporter substrate-binding protein [Nocardioides sp.]
MTDTLSNLATSRRSLVIGGGLGLAAMSLGLTSCSSDGGGGGKGAPKPTGPTREFSAGPSADGTPVKGGTLRIGVFGGNPAETLNPQVAVSIADNMRLYNLFEPLFAAGPDGSLTPKLATDAVSNDKADVWMFHLRKGVTWHDGKPFTADDVVFTIKNSWGAPTNYFNACLANIVDFGNVAKLDAFTVKVPLKLPIADFPSVTAFPNLYIIQDGTTDFTLGVGTGPFALQSFKPGSSSTFTANANHWREGGVHVDELIINSSFQTEESRFNALLAGDLDIVPQALPSLAAANASDGRIVLGHQPGPAMLPMIMRVDKGSLSNPQIRQALKMIPDREVFVSNVYNGYASATNDAPGRTDKYWAEDLVQPQDLEQAKSLLKAAGAENFEVELRTSTVVAGMNETATLFKQQAKGAGVNVNLKTYTPATYYSAEAGVFDRDFCLDFAAQGMNSLALFYMTWMLPGAPYNQSFYGGDEADKTLMLDAMGETDEAAAADKWHAVQEGQVKDGPYIIPAAQNWLDAYGENVRGVQTTTAYTCNGYDFASAWLV